MNKTGKPWGFEKILYKNEKWKVKVLHINKGHRLSEQFHRKKWEIMFLPNREIKEIKPKIIHRPSARDSKKEIGLEISTNIPDSDIVRTADDYER